MKSFATYLKMTALDPYNETAKQKLKNSRRQKSYGENKEGYSKD